MKPKENTGRPHYGKLYEQSEVKAVQVEMKQLKVVQSQWNIFGGFENAQNGMACQDHRDRKMINNMEVAIADEWYCTMESNHV